MPEFTAGNSLTENVHIYVYEQLWHFAFFEFYLGEEMTIQQIHKKKKWFSRALTPFDSNPVLTSIHSHPLVGYVEHWGL